MTYRWLPLMGKRHAIPMELKPGDSGETLCGTTVSPVPEFTPPSQWPAWWRECEGCDEQWRQAEGIPLRHNRITARVR
ncbi:zinc finger protein [Actinosynnema sp. CA-248983]